MDPWGESAQASRYKGPGVGGHPSANVLNQLAL